MTKEDMLSKVNCLMKNLEILMKLLILMEKKMNLILMVKKKKSNKLRFNGITHNAICFTKNDTYACENLEYTIRHKFFDDEYTF